MSASPNRCRVVQGLIADVCLASSASCPTCRLMCRLKLFRGFRIPSVEQVGQVREDVAQLRGDVDSLEVWRALQEAGPRPEQAPLACMHVCVNAHSSAAQQVAELRPQLQDVQREIGALRRQVQAHCQAQAQAPVPPPHVHACLHETLVFLGPSHLCFFARNTFQSSTS